MKTKTRESDNATSEELRRERQRERERRRSKVHPGKKLSKSFCFVIPRKAFRAVKNGVLSAADAYLASFILHLSCNDQGATDATNHYLAEAMGYAHIKATSRVLARLEEKGILIITPQTNDTPRLLRVVWGMKDNRHLETALNPPAAKVAKARRKTR